MHKAKEGFKRKKVEVLTLGEQLVKLREKHGVSIEHLADYVKIQEKYLRALENGFYNKLPSGVYIKGYLREYENFFNLKEEVLVKAFEKEYNIYKNINKSNEIDDKKLSKVNKKTRIIITPKIFIIAFVTIILLLIGGYLYYGVNKFISEPWISIENPKNGFETDKKSIIVRGFTHPDAILKIGGKNVSINKNGAFSEKVALVPGKNLITIKSKNSTNKFSEKTLIIFSTQQPVEEVINNDNEKKESIITLKSKKQLWIIIKVDDLKSKKIEMDTDIEYSFKFKEKISISAQNGNNIMVNLNGKERGLLSETKGEVQDIIFTNESAL